MCQFSNNYPTCTENDLDLYELDAFSEKVYKDPEYQKLGFFKLKLKDTSGKTPLRRLIGSYTDPAVDTLASWHHMSSPHGNSGLYHVRKKAEIKQPYIDNYKALISDVQSYNINENSCCMKELRAGEGAENFTKHFFEHMARTAEAPPQCGPDLKQKQTLEKALKRLNDFKTAKTAQEKHDFLVDAVVSERVVEADQVIQSEDGASKCKSPLCRACMYTGVNDCSNESVYHDPNVDALYSAGVDVAERDIVRVTKTFAMKTFCYKNSLSLTDSIFPGINQPQMYIGTGHSYFAIHVEDSCLWSFNVVLYGAPKCWIIIPPEEVGKLTAALVTRGFGFLQYRCSNILGHKCYIPSIAWLRKENIMFSVVVQNANEGLILFPNAAHYGVNLGINWAIASNFTTPSQIPYAISYPGCPCLGADAIHKMDITRLVSTFHSHLLQPCLQSEDILARVDDPHFHKSVAVRKIVPSQPNAKEPIKCQWCDKSWKATTRKENVVKHYRKYHLKKMDLALTTSHLQSHFYNYDATKKK